LFALLESARFYDGFERLLGADSLRAEFVSTYVRPGDLPRARILDVGCGTARLLEHLGDCDYLGVDISERYLEAARRRHPRGARFARIDVGDPDLLPGAGPFDLVIVSALLHHLDDAHVDAVLAAAARVLAPSGRLVALETTVTPESPLVARALAAADRGRHVRPPEEYGRLAAARFARVVVHVRHDLLRVPYCHAILECSRG
jgi:SAM-dependent methyltransferase